MDSLLNHLQQRTDMRIKIFALIMLAGISCTKKTKYPGKWVNPLLPSIHSQHEEQKNKARTPEAARPEQSGVVAVVNTTEKSFLIYFDARGNLRHRAFSGIFATDKEGLPQLWQIHKEVIKKKAGILFKAPLTFDVLTGNKKVLMSGASIIRDLEDQITHAGKDRNSDFANLVYHKSFRPFACALGTVTYLVKETQYWPGAAHPDAISSLVTLNTKTLRKMVFAKQFSINNLLKTANSRKKLDKCLSSFDSVVPVKGRGGSIRWMASFNHRFAYCNGMIDYRRVGPPPGFQQSGPRPCVLKHGILSDKDGKLLARSVWDYRAPGDCNLVIYLQKTGPTDMYRLSPFSKGRARRRNLYILVRNMDKKILLGRASRILCADFPDHAPLQEYLKK